MLTLRPYQTDARYQLNALLNASRHPVFVSPTGTGKTATATAVIADRVSIGRRVFVLVPSVEIFGQWITDLSDAGLNPGYINDEGMKGQNRHVYVCMAQSLVNILDRVPEKLWPDEIFTDECHHSAASTWETIYTFFDQATRCGLTATPERLDGKGLDHLYTDIVQTITMREAVDAGYLAKPLPIVPQKYLETHDIPDGNPDAPGALEAQAAKLGKLEIIGDVLESYRHIFHGKPVLVACATFGHAELMTERFVEAGWCFEHIHSALPKQERRRMLRGIRSGTIHGLCTVGIGIEGMDIPGLYGLIWLRRTRSLTIYLQFCVDENTEILTKRGWVGINGILCSDISYGLNTETGLIEESKIKNIIKRASHENERMFGIKNQHLDIRVTENHDVLYSSKNSNKFMKRQACDFSEMKAFTKIYTAGNMDIGDCPEISDAELSFLGWFLSDGTRNKKTNAIAIYQSLSHPEYIKEIEGIIIDCGFKYGRCLIKRSGVWGKYNDCVMFYISNGNPKKNQKHLSGYKKIEAWCDKSIPDCYNRLSRRQLLVLLKTLFNGDGSKRAKVKYTVGTMSITCGDNKRMADRIQELCVTRGLSCNISTAITPHGTKTYNLYIKDVLYRTVAGKNISNGTISGKKPYTRPRFRELVKVEGELVWCIENTLGTIITRRNGKVSITGNCGRVLRPLPGKKYGVILDPVGNLFLHGFPEADRVWSLAGRGDGSGQSEPPEVPVRICPWCGVANNPENERCHFCGMQLLDEDGNRVTKKRDLPSFVAGQLIAVTSDGDRQAVEDAIISDVEEAQDAQKKEHEKEARVLTSTEKKDILLQGIFAGRERRPLFNEAVRGMID